MNVCSLLGRMLSPNPIIQNPTNSQNFNRYSYALNNPMVYTDPSGYYSGSGSSGNSYYIDGMQVSAGAFSACTNGLDFGSYSIEGYGNEYEEFNLAIFNFEKEMKQREFRLKLEESKYILFNYKYPPIFINTSAHLYTSSFDGGGPIKKNSQSSNTFPNFVPKISDFMYQEASSDFGNTGATSGVGDEGGSTLTWIGLGLKAAELPAKGTEGILRSFQSSNYGVLNAAIVNDFPTSRINGIIKSTSTFSTAVKWTGRGFVIGGAFVDFYEGTEAVLDKNYNKALMSGLNLGVGLGTAAIGGPLGVGLYTSYKIIMAPPPGNPSGYITPLCVTDKTIVILPKN